jgi:hypothetical protein
MALTGFYSVFSSSFHLLVQTFFSEATSNQHPICASVTPAAIETPLPAPASVTGLSG